MLKGAMKEISENPSDYQPLIIVLFGIIALAIGIPAILSGNLKRILSVIIFAILITFAYLFFF